MRKAAAAAGIVVLVLLGRVVVGTVSAEPPSPLLPHPDLAASSLCVSR